MERKLLIAGLGLALLACVGLAAWIVLLTRGHPIWVAALVAVLVVTGVVVIAVPRLRARLSAHGLERDLLDQARAQVQSTRPDRRHQAEQLQRDFVRAVRELKASRLGRAGRDALYLLPWYAMIGPSGAGKTTALRNSGLRFPNLRGQEHAKVKGLGGTRNCDFWLSHEAVILDTAGRWSTQDDDHHEWLGFLRLLRKHRRRKPLNGLIAAISVGDVVNARPEDIDALAQCMRDRLEELSSELGVSLPVYVLFTKCDLLEGFIEMFGALRASEREQILGFTVPLAAEQLAPERCFDEHFDALGKSLCDAALTRMGEERGATERQLVYAFPGQFAAMRASLGRFVARLFEVNAYQDSLPLRGIYFSSATQEGRPFSLLDEAYGAAPALEPVDQKGYFLRELFSHVIFEDKAIASANELELRRRRRSDAALSSLLCLLALLLGVLPMRAFVRSRQQLTVTAKLVAAAAVTTPLSARLAPMFTPAARRLWADLRQYGRVAPGWFESLGMGAGRRVLPGLQRYAARRLRDELAAPVMVSDLRALTDFGLRYAALPHALPTAVEHARLYAALKLHLLLTDAALPNQHVEWVEDQLASRWQATSGRMAHELAHEYVYAMQRYPELAFARDVEVVQRVRSTLNRSSAAQQTLDAIVAHVATLDYDIDLPKLVGYTSALIGRRRVRGAFTRRGWETAVRDLFAGEAPDHVAEPWVLERSSNPALADRPARQAELETLYFREYRAEWLSFLAGIRTQSPRSAGSEALALLSELTAGDPTPLGRLFRGVYDNVRLTALPSAATSAQAPDPAPRRDLLARIWKPAVPRSTPSATRPADKPSDFAASSVAEAFERFTAFGVPANAGDDAGPGKAPAPVPYDSYREQLSYLRDGLQLRLDNPAEGPQLEARIQTAMVRVRGLIDSQPATFRPVLDALLWPPIRGLRDGADHDSAAWIAQQWCSEVVAPFEQSLLGRYPFSPSTRDSRLEDFDAFYRPSDGLLWKFTSNTLTDQVQLVGADFGYGAKYQHAGGAPYSRALLEFLNRSRSIMRAFYAGPSGPRLDFSVRIHAASSRVDTTTFSVGGKRVSYDNGPLTWQPLTWPGPDPERGAAFSVHGRMIRAGNDIAGPWGLFRLLETGKLERSGDDALSVKWRLPADDLEVWLELRPARAPSPWFDAQERTSLQFLRLLRGTAAAAPHRVSRAQTACTP